LKKDFPAHFAGTKNINGSDFMIKLFKASLLLLFLLSTSAATAQ
jgi:hypothetical protein